MLFEYMGDLGDSLGKMNKMVLCLAAGRKGVYYGFPVVGQYYNRPFGDHTFINELPDHGDFEKGAGFAGQNDIGVAEMDEGVEALRQVFG